MKMHPEDLIKNHENISVCVIGLGRIGLPLATLLADAGYNVIGLGIIKESVDQINNGICQFRDEPGLPELLKKTVEVGRFKATLDAEFAITNSDVIVICVPTPVDEANHPNYSAIIDSCKTIAKYLRRDSLVLIESTVGPGTVENLIIFDKMEKEKVIWTIF